MPSSRPGEPVTEGLPFGPGAGPEAISPLEPEDEMEVVLQAMVQLTGDQSVANMLTDHREFKAWQNQRAQAPQPIARPELSAVPDSVDAEFTDDIEVDTTEEFALPAGEQDLATEEEPVEAGESNPAAPVETPASAPPTEAL
jgi:hypothetical protein